MTTEEEFDVLTSEFLTKMGSVKCPSEEYRAGLQAAIDEIRASIQASEEMPG